MLHKYQYDKPIEHCNTVTVQDSCMFREIPFFGYLVMTQFNVLSISRAITFSILEQVWQNEDCTNVKW